MNRTGSEPLQCRDVSERGVAEVPRESIAGIARVEFAHVRIPVGLRQDRCGADRGHQIIPAHERFDTTIPKEISELWRFIPVNNDMHGAYGQGLQSAAHRQQRRLQHVDRIDLRRQRQP